MSQNDGGFVERSFGKVLVLGFVTLGIYFLYWMHSVNVQLAEAEGADYNPTMRTVGLIIPIYNFLVLWKIGKSAEDVLPDVSGTAVFVTSIVFFPIAVYLLQSAINEAA